MTVSSEENTKIYVGDASTTDFAFPYLFYANSHIIVTVDDVVTTSYTLTGAENPSGGTVSFSSAPANNATIVIQRIVPYTQSTDLENFDGNPADVTEKQFDLLSMADQQLNEQVARAILAPIGKPFTSNTITGTIDATARILTVTQSGISASSLASISTELDTLIATPQDGDFLQYDSGFWRNFDLYAGDNAFSGDNTFSGASAFTGTTNFQGVTKVTGKQLQLSKGADIASASALPLLTDGNFFDVTGTTTITSIATSGKVGTEVTLQFDGALTLTHHATDLILPTGANITTAAGDVAKFIEYASGDWVCISYVRASGAALANTAFVTQATSQATTSGTSIDFTSIPAGVKRLIINFVGVSTNGSNNLALTLNGETSGYLGTVERQTTATNLSVSFTLTTGGVAAGSLLHGQIILSLAQSSTNTWTAMSTLSRSDTGQLFSMSGSKALSGVLSSFQVNAAGNTFDAGFINYQYEL